MNNLSDRAALEVMDSIREELESEGETTLTKRDLAWLSPAIIALNAKYFAEHPVPTAGTG